MQISRRTIDFTLVAALLLSTAQRLPAPISEIETPTPPRAQRAKAKESAVPKEQAHDEISLDFAEKKLNGTWVLKEYQDVDAEGEITISITNNRETVSGSFADHVRESGNPLGSGTVDGVKMVETAQSLRPYSGVKALGGSKSICFESRPASDEERLAIYFAVTGTFKIYHTGGPTKSFNIALAYCTRKNEYKILKLFPTNGATQEGVFVFERQ